MGFDLLHRLFEHSVKSAVLCVFHLDDATGFLPRDDQQSEQPVSDSVFVFTIRLLTLSNLRGLFQDISDTQIILPNEHFPEPYIRMIHRPPHRWYGHP